MQYSFRLAELLRHEPDPKKRPGTIKSIVEHTGLDRHQVASLLKNEIKYIPLKALSRLCDYLIENGYATADQLPGALFAVEPENFWEMLARRTRLEMCMGVRKDMDHEEAGVAFLSASDAIMMGEILNGVTTLGGTTKHLKHRPASNSEAYDDKVSAAVGEKSGTGSESGDAGDILPYPQPEQLKQSLVWSPGQLAPRKVKARANEVFDRFSDTPGDKALICLGSTKSNPVVEIVLSNAFNCEPFSSQDTVANPNLRGCPFFIRYRDNDPQPKSCFGGKAIAKSDKRAQPGIYYENKDGEWLLANEHANSQMVAFLFYIHRESLGRLELVLGGFSGAATRALAKAISKQAEDFWPPEFNDGGIQIGAYVVEFDNPEAPSVDDLEQTDFNPLARIISISKEAIQRRLK